MAPKAFALKFYPWARRFMFMRKVIHLSYSKLNTKYQFLHPALLTRNDWYWNDGKSAVVLKWPRTVLLAVGCQYIGGRLQPVKIVQGKVLDKPDILNGNLFM